MRRRLTLILAIAAIATSAAGCGVDPTATTRTEGIASQTVDEQSAASRNLYENVADSPGLSIFWRLINRAGRQASLSGAEQFTLFAPIDAAFKTMPRYAWARLWVEVNRERVGYLVGFQMLRGRYDAARLKRVARASGRITTVEGEKLTPRLDGDELSIEDKFGRRLPVVQQDVPASNGLLHVVGGIPVPRAYF